MYPFQVVEFTRVVHVICHPHLEPSAALVGFLITGPEGVLVTCQLPLHRAKLPGLACLFNSFQPFFFLLPHPVQFVVVPRFSQQKLICRNKESETS